MLHKKLLIYYIFAALFLIVFLLWFLYLRFNTSLYLAFSDSAKFADVARNIVKGWGYKTSFSFFSPSLLEQPHDVLFTGRGIPVAMPLSIAEFFSLFGISDSSVVLVSGLFYVLLVLVTFALGKKLFGNLVGFLAAVAIASNLNFLDYATSGASETLFALEIVLAAYLLLLQKKWATTTSFLILILLYFTRPQGFIFIGGFIFLWLLLRLKLKNALLVFLLFALLIFGLDKLVLYPLSFQLPVYPILTRGLQAIFQYSASTAVSDALRGGVGQQLGAIEIVKKVFYNLYNFYKLLPQIASPYMWGLFTVGLFRWGKSKIENSLKFITLLMVISTFLVAALTIPFFRYLHPVIPLVYLFATATLIWVVEKMIDYSWPVISKYLPKKIKTKLFATVIASSLLIIFFVVGQTLGTIFLDSRFKAARTNKGKPPVYVQLSWLLRDNTSLGDVIITNLDTWGSWYGERKTVWFPLEPNQLIPSEGQENQFDAIFLTSYLIDDENYYMGEEWRQIFYNPENPENEFIADNFELKNVYQVSAEDTYEKQDARAVLLVRKEH